METVLPIEGQPGLFKDDAGHLYNVRDHREGDKYDTIRMPAGAVTAGTQYIFFQDIQGKREVDTNIKTPRKLSAGESMIMDRVGIYVRSVIGNIVAVPRDVKKLVDNSFFRLKINDILQCEGPSVAFPSGLGLYGQTTEDDAGIVAIGVPATASAARFAKKQLLNQNHELDGILEFGPRTWLNGVYTAPETELDMAVTCLIHGLIRAAVTK